MVLTSDVLLIFTSERVVSSSFKLKISSKLALRTRGVAYLVVVGTFRMISDKISFLFPLSLSLSPRLRKDLRVHDFQARMNDIDITMQLPIDLPLFV